MQNIHLFPSIRSRLDSFPFVLSFLDASLGEYFLMHASSIILMLCLLSHKKSARRRLCIKGLLLPKGTSRIEVTPYIQSLQGIKQDIHAFQVSLLFMQESSMYASLAY